MNKQTKNFILVLITALILYACGQAETVSTPEPIVIENPNSTTEPVEDVPTSVPSGEDEPGQFSQYIGLVYPPVPGDLTQGFNMIIQDTDSYGLSLVSDGGYKMLWLSKVVQYDAGGSPLWEVKDVLPLSSLEPGLTLLPDGCFLNGAPDSEVIVAGRNGAIVLAWRADTTLDVFEVIPTTGIECNSDKAVNLD